MPLFYLFYKKFKTRLKITKIEIKITKILNNYFYFYYNYGLYITKAKIVNRKWNNLKSFLDYQYTIIKFYILYYLIENGLKLMLIYEGVKIIYIV